MKKGKNYAAAIEKINAADSYNLDDASSMVKDITKTKFDSSVDLDIRLGVDPRKADQMVRGIATLPHGTGKVTRVLVLCGNVAMPHCHIARVRE